MVMESIVMLVYQRVLSLRIGEFCHHQAYKVETCWSLVLSSKITVQQQKHLFKLIVFGPTRLSAVYIT